MADDLFEQTAAHREKCRDAIDRTLDLIFATDFVQFLAVRAPVMSTTRADGLGGFASGTVSGVRTRRYHALLLTATTPPTGRVVLVNGFEAWVDGDGGSAALTTQRYSPGVLHPDGASRITSFVEEPWPTWQFAASGGVTLTQELFAAHGTGTVVVTWTLTGGGPIDLRVRPLLSGRDYHSTHHENAAFRFDVSRTDACTAFRPSTACPRSSRSPTVATTTLPSGIEWYRHFLYAAEQERGLDATEDLASPGVLTWRLSAPGDRAIWILKAGGTDAPAPRTQDDVLTMYGELAERERDRRAAFVSPLDRAADAYLVQRGAGRTIIAGYPWFTDWGRDAFIALRGLCLATGRLRDARDILVAWAGAVSEGMPAEPVSRRRRRARVQRGRRVTLVCRRHRCAAERAERLSTAVTPADREVLEFAVLSIVDGYAAGIAAGDSGRRARARWSTRSRHGCVDARFRRGRSAN